MNFITLYAVCNCNYYRVFLSLKLNGCLFTAVLAFSFRGTRLISDDRTVTTCLCLLLGSIVSMMYVTIVD